ncbi:hypothetical protein BpHYR1_013802 [Brachionus plicatilis]|uniref:Uncharacterized protein n=1 Tax=Brachionus plicatilis TaxID=10195 RepID=A0A3M7SWV6_BRAPC|nr:hypothetical protein BpHYR1_013802 [Brachionus plicatilis]
MKKKFLFFLSYSANSLKSSYKKCETVQNDYDIKTTLRKFLISFFKQEPKINFAVNSYHGTNALMNAASVEFPIKLDFDLHNSKRFNNVLNFKIRDRQLGFKVLNIYNVSDHFCINRAALHSKYVFRFTTQNSDHLNIFEYPILTKLKHDINLECLESNLNQFALFSKKNAFTMFNNEENFLRRKFMINPLQLKLVKNTQTYMGNLFPIHLIEIENFPINQSKEIFSFLDAILINSREKNNENFVPKVEEAFRAEEFSKFYQNKAIDDLNGLFLTDISFDQKIIEHENLQDII